MATELHLHEGDTAAAPARAMTALKLLGLIVLSVGPYIPSLSGGFLWDDNRWLGDDPVIARGAGPRAYWTGREATVDFLPVTSTAFWAQWHLFGLHAVGYRLVNLALHAAGAVLVWRVLAVLAVPAAWLAAAAFALHPVNVASVAWIAEQKNTLSLLPLAGAMLAYLRFDARGGRAWYALAAGLFVLACLAKVSAVVLPVAMLGCAWRRRGRIGLADLRRVAPFLLLAGLVVYAGMRTQQARAWAQAGANAPEGLLEHLALASRALGFYAAKAVAPVKLAMIYPQWDLHAFTAWWFVPLGLAVVAEAVLIWRRQESWARSAALALGCYAAALLPVLGFVNLSYMALSYVADHWHYLALIPAAGLAVGAAAAGLRRWRTRPRWLAPAAGAVLLAVLAGLTGRRAALFGDRVALWAHSVDANPTSWAARFNLGRCLEDAGRPDEAAEQYRRTIALRGDHVKARYSLGLVWYKRSDKLEAQRWFESALAINADYLEARHCLAMILSERERHAEAAVHWRRLAEQQPARADFLQQLGLCLFKAGQYAESAEAFRQELALRSDDPVAHANLGAALLQLGQVERAVGHCRAALAFDPDCQLARSNLSVALERLARLPASHPAAAAQPETKRETP